MVLRVLVGGLGSLFLALALLPGAGGDPAAATAADPVSPAQRRHWAYRPPARPPVPRVGGQAWVRNPVDAFVLARLEAAGLSPAPPASKTTLLRRVTFDLTGLPPTPAEIDAFLRDRSATAYEQAVRRLLASPRYGERWARHWLDLVRYADSNGYEHDELRPDAWRYRDYVVRSFNADKPYDAFIREQLAGDLIADGGLRIADLGESGPDRSGQSAIRNPQSAIEEVRDGRIATGFNLLGPDMTDAVDQATRRQVTLNDLTDTIGLTFLGMTVGCARCHDHKYEAIPQTDYYRLQAFFAGAEFRADLPIATPGERERHAQAMAPYEAALAPVEAEMRAIEAPHRERLVAARRARLAEDVREALAADPARRTQEQQLLAAAGARALVVPAGEVERELAPPERERYRALQEQRRRLEGRKPPPLPVAMGLREGGAPAVTHLLERGEFDARGPEVACGFPVVLTGGRAAPAPRSRLALAAWLASPANPLTARVLVNRLWQHHFGRGLVATPSDFGERGDPPTHPDLLDWLAVTFREGTWKTGLPGGRGPGSPAPAAAWRLKPLHYLLVTSNTYRQSSTGRPPNPRSAIRNPQSIDPDNRLLWRMNRRRLEGEAVRDASLAVGGTLSLQMGGPGVVLAAAAGPKAAVAAGAGEENRRSLYLFVRRNSRLALLEAFDAPDTNLSCPRREVTTTAPQALALLNGPEAAAAARALAGRLAREAGGGMAERITLAYRLALGRWPTARERRIGIEFLERHASLLPPGHGAADRPALPAYCLALLNANEFVYVD